MSFFRDDWATPGAYKITVRWESEFGCNVMSRYGQIFVDREDTKIFDFGEPTHEKLIAHRVGADWKVGQGAFVEWGIAQEIDSWADLKISPFHDGRVLGECRICPPKVRDVRDARNGPAHSGHMGRSEEDAELWFQEHVDTDIHEHYRINGTGAPFVFARAYR